MKKILSLLLVALMIIGMLPMMPITANAAGDTYELVTNVNQLAVGKKVIIVANKSNVAMSTTQNTNNRGQVSVNKETNEISNISSSVQVLTLEAGTVSGTFAFNTGSGYLYAASSGSNYLKTQKTNNANGSWKITVTNDGVATVKAQGSNTRNWMRYNSSNSLFACYSSGQGDISLYVLKESTGGETSCDHANATTTTVDATCTTAGSTTVTCECGYEKVTENPALGHDFSNGESCANCGEKITVVAYQITTAEEFVTGEYVVVVDTGYALGIYSSGWVTAVQPTIVGTNVTDAANGIWTLTVNGSNVKLTDANNATVLYSSTTSAGITSKDGTWVWSVDSNGNFTFADAAAANVKLASNKQSSNQFRAYKAATADGYPHLFKLYKVGTPCTHTNIVAVGEAKDATCDVDGLTAGEKCADCGKVIKEQEPITALGHNFDKEDICTNCGAPKCSHASQNTVTTDATCAKPGSIVVTCADCGKSISEEEIPATGEHNYASVINPEATCTTDGLKTDTCSVCGDIKTETIPAIGHNYVDGICANCSEPKPASLAGRYYIAAIRSSGNYFYMTSDLGTASTKRYQVVDSGSTTLPETITASENDNKVFVLVENADGTYCIYAEGTDGDAKYLGWSSGNSGILAAEAEALKLTIDKLESGLVNIHFTGDAERYLALNNNSGSNYFAWYKSGQKQDLSLIPVVEGGSENPDPDPELPVDPPASCEHTNTTAVGEAKEATCTEAGITAGEKCADCGETITAQEEIPATGHNPVDGICSVCQKAIVATKVTSAEELVSGRYVMVVDTGYAMGKLDGTWITAVQPTVEGNYVTDTAGGVWTLTVAEGGTVTIKDFNNTFVKPEKEDDNGISSGEYSWKYSFDEATGTFTFAGVQGGVQLASNTTKAEYVNKFRAYKIKTITDSSSFYHADFTLYKLPDCKHNFVEGSCTVCGAADPDWKLDTPEKIVNAAYKLEAGASLEGTYTLTGVITSVDYAFSPKYNNVTVTIQIGEMADKLIQCYRLEGEGADQIGVGDTITVTGILTNYKGTVEFDEGCTLNSYTFVPIKVKSWNLTLGDDISVNFNIHVADDIKESTWIKVTFNGKTTTYNASEIKGAVKVNVAAAQMGDKITVKIVNGEQEIVKEYSVKAYADYILDEENGYDELTKKLVTEMLAYGAAAQTYFGYNKNNLVFTGTAGAAEPTTATEMIVGDPVEGVRFYGASLVFENKIAIRYYFVVDEGVKLTVEGDYKIGKSNDLQYVEIADILPQELNEDYTVTVNDGLTVTYSPMNYIVRMYAKGGAVKDLVQALYNYHLAAEEFVAPKTEA